MALAPVRRAVSVLAILGFLGHPSSAQGGSACAPEWTFAGSSPSGFGPAQLVYDSMRQRVVFVTGPCATGQPGDVWEHDGTGWVAGVPMPAPRGYAALAFDAARGETVLFGGYAEDCSWDCNMGGFRGDTWTYDGSSWRPRGWGGPGERMAAAMAYDPVRRLTVLHGGGEPYNLCSWDMSQTWEWDGAAWTRGPDGPGAFMHAMAYDELGSRMVVVFYGDTWFYDGTWSAGPPHGASPVTSYWSAVTYDTDRGLTLLYTGDKLYEFDGASWTTSGAALPGTRNGHGLVYDAGRSRAMLVDSTGVWEYTPTIAISPPTLPPGSVGSPYQATITASGGSGGFVFSAGRGALPPGLAIEPGGLLSGAPGASGTFRFEVVATGVGGDSCVRAYSLEIASTGCPSIQITPPFLPGGFVGLPYQRLLEATGGTPPHVFSISAGSLPAGLALSGGGLLSGIPTAEGTSTFTVLATDAQSCSGARTYTLTVLGRSLGRDVVAGRGAGRPNPNELRVFTSTGSPTSVDLFAFQAGAWGVHVGAGQLDATAPAEILAGPGPGEVLGPHVRAFRNDGAAVAKVTFYAYSTPRYGVEVEGGDLEGDGYSEIVTGAGPGSVFGPHVRAFDVDGAGATAIAKVNFFAYATLRFGAIAGGGDVDADGRAEILTGPGPGGVFSAMVRGFDYDGVALRAIPPLTFDAHATTYGAVVRGGDVDGDGRAEIVAAPGAGAPNPMFVLGFGYDGAAVSRLLGFEAIPASSAYGARIALVELDTVPGAELVAGPGPDPAAPPRAFEYAYEGAMLVPMPGSFDAFPGTYGLTVAGGALDL